MQMWQVGLWGVWLLCPASMWLTFMWHFKRLQLISYKCYVTSVRYDKRRLFCSASPAASNAGSNRNTHQPNTTFTSFSNLSFFMQIMVERNIDLLIIASSPTTIVLNCMIKAINLNTLWRALCVTWLCSKVYLWRKICVLDVVQFVMAESNPWQAVM